MWTSTEDVANRWVGGGDIPATDEQIEALIEDVEDTILSADPLIQMRVDDLTLPIIRINKVVARVVMRHLRNPSGMRSTQQSAGSFQVSNTFGGAEPGALFLTDDDLIELGIRKRGERAFMIDLLGADAGAAWNEMPDLWQP